MNLTPKQEAFAREYLRDGNATQAAIRAGYSPRSACQIGHEVLHKPQVAERIAMLLDESSDPEDGCSRSASFRMSPFRKLAFPASGIIPIHAEDRSAPLKDAVQGILQDIRRIGSRAESEGDLKTALKALEMAVKLHEQMTGKQNSSAHGDAKSDGAALPVTDLGARSADELIRMARALYQTECGEASDAE